MKFNLGSMASPLGEILIVTDPEGALYGLDLIDCVSCQPRILGAGHQLTYCSPPTEISSALNQFFEGDLRALLNVEVRPIGSAFQLRVWDALRHIPAGQTTSYGELATSLGYEDPRMAKIVGAANAANPIAIVIPCHRVIAKNGDLKGYAWGVERKKWLLDHEGCTTPPGISLSLPGF